MMNRLMCFLVPLLFVRGLLGCQDKQAALTKTDNELVVSVVDGKLVSNLKSVDLIRFTQRILNEGFKSNPAWKNGKVTESHVELSGAYYYLLSQVKDEKTGKVLYNSAIELRKEPTGKQGAGLRTGADGVVTNGVPIEQHTCAGNPCPSCSFTKQNGKIVGCDCNNYSSSSNKCDHTVTTTQ